MRPIEESIAEVIEQANDGQQHKVWKTIFQMMNDDVLAKAVEDRAAVECWGREKLATVLAAVLMIQGKQQREEILRLSMMQPPAPILVPKGQIVYLPGPGPEHQGPGC